MDAMAVVSTQTHQVVFVARADIFKKPIVIKFLNFLRILPIYRKRDGGNSFYNNQETFKIVDQVLRSGMAHGILPEGVYNPFKRLGPLQKGIFRTALKAQESYGNKGGVKIVPVGLNWQDPKAFFKDVTIVYGKPIDIVDYYPLYLENPAKAYLVLQKKLAEEMRKLMIDIRSEKDYSTIEDFRETFGSDYAIATNRNPNHALERLHAEQELVKKLDLISEQDEEKMQSIKQSLSDYQSGLKKLKLRSKLLQKTKVSFLELIEDFGVLLLGLPIAIIGSVLGFLPLTLQKKFEKLIEDPQFISSTRFVVALAVRMIQNFVMVVIALLTYNTILQLILIFLLLAYAERLMLFYVEHYKRTMGKWRYFLLLRKNDKSLNELRTLRNQLLEISEESKH